MDNAFPAGGRLAAPRLRQGNVRDRLLKLAGFFEAEDIWRAYVGMVSHWKEPEALVLGSAEPPFPADASAWPGLRDAVHRMMCLDMMTYLPDDILVKVDRASMAASLESRAPFLDHRPVEFCWRLPKEGSFPWTAKVRHLPSARGIPRLVDEKNYSDNFGLSAIGAFALRWVGCKTGQA